MNWYLKVLKQYADFSGRARRKEYWMFTLITIIIQWILSFVDKVIGISLNVEVGLLSGAYSLAVLIPGLAVSVRRLHDVGKSGWMLLLIFLPIIGWIWLFVLTVLDSAPDENKYGPNPKKEIV